MKVFTESVTTTTKSGFALIYPPLMGGEVIVNGDNEKNGIFANC